MNNNIINKEDKQISSLFQRMEQLSDTMDNTVRAPKSKLGGEQYLTDKETVRLLKISKRTLQGYRLGGKLPFYRIGAKILYRMSDIEHFLKTHYESRQTSRHFMHI